MCVCVCVFAPCFSLTLCKTLVCVCGCVCCPDGAVATLGQVMACAYVRACMCLRARVRMLVCVVF